VDKQVVGEKYFAELAQLRQGLKETGTYSGDGDMKRRLLLRCTVIWTRSFRASRSKSSQALCASIVASLKSSIKSRTRKLKTGRTAKYQIALICRKGDCDGVALAYVKQRFYANSLFSFSQADVNFCIYLLNEIVPREDARKELAICYYRKGWVKDASGMASTRGLAIAGGEMWMLCDFKPDELPYSDEIMARRLLDKVIYRLQNTADPASVLRNSNYLQDKILLAEAYLSYAKKRKKTVSNC